VPGAYYLYNPITIEDRALQAPGTAFRLDAAKLKPFVPGA
jgi:hypothetical protein